MKINFNHASFKYNRKSNFVLKDINLEFSQNEIVFIMGHTGSGKSSLVQHLNGLLLADEGNVSIEFDGTSYCLSKKNKEKRIKEIRKKIGFVFQFSEYQLFETTVLRDVMFGPINFFRDQVKAEELAKKALKLVGIDESYYERSPFELSGGEKRKVALAGVLASNPDVIVLDEPTSSLDYSSSMEIMKLLVKLKNEGKTIIIISHDSDLCYEYANRLIVLKNGEILKDGKPEDVFKSTDALKDAGVLEPFVYKAKNALKIKDEGVKSIDDLKKVISHE